MSDYMAPNFGLMITPEALAARDRENLAIGWDEGFEAGFDFVDHTPRGVSIDPPLNPYRGDNR